MHRAFLILLVAGVSVLSTAAAQEDEIIPSRVFTPRDGLPGEHVTAITQMSNGLLWVGTSAGMAYFDGSRFQEVSFPDSLTRQGVISLLPDSDNSLWVTTSNHGVWHLSSDLRPRKLTALGDRAFSTVITRGSSTFFLGYTQAWALDGHADQPRQLQYQYEITAPALARSSATGTGAGLASAAVAPDGRLVILDRVLGPGVLDPKASTAFGSGNVGAWTSIALDAEGQLWALDYERGLFRLDQDLVPRLVLASEGNHHVLIDGTTAYISTRSGVVRYDLVAGRLLGGLDRTTGVPASDARVTFVDHEGSLWIGTRSHLVQVPQPRVRHVKHVEGERLLNVAILAPASGGELWASSYGGGLVRLAPSLKMEQPYQSTRWTSVSASTDGQPFAIGNAGVARLEAGGWRPTLLIPDAVRGVAGDSETVYIWKDHGAFRYSTTDGSAVTLYEWPVDQRNYHAIGSTPDGDVVIRAHNLVLRARVDQNGSTVRLDTLARLDGVEQSGGRYLAMDHTEAVWIGFWDRGLVRVHGGVATAVLPNENVTRLNVSGGSLVFASTTTGLYAFDVATQQLAFSLHREDGLLSNVTTGAAVLNGVLFVAHPTGVTKLPLDVAGRPLPAPPRVHLAPVGVPGAGAHAGAGAVPRLGRDASFRFFATSYLNPSAISYDYRLGGGEWAPAEGNVLQFHRLAGGQQTLEVRARYKNGDPGPVASYAFSVPTPFYEATWFRLLLLVALAVLGGFVYAARSQIIKRRETELKELVEERTQRLAEAMRTTERQADLLRQHDEVKTRFFTDISHEFRTPLTLIRGVVHDVVEGRHGPVDQDAEERLVVVSDNADRLARLVEELLDLSRLEAGRMTLQPQHGDLVAHLRALIRAHAPAAERAGVLLDEEYDAESYPAVFDSGSVERVVANLISNALKHTPTGGHVHVSFSPDEEGSGVAITVRDDGTGIPENLLPHIFDRFVLGQEEAGSSGIGLALVKELVALHEGTIKVESEEGCGSCFTVSLPLVRQSSSGDGYASDGLPPNVSVEHSNWEERHTDPPARDPDPAPADADGVLVVDDNADIRAYVAAHLAERYRTYEASGGAEALALAREVHPALIMSDVMMPGMSGDELCRQLRADESLAHIPVILLTARAGGQAAAEGLRSGADAYVEKPFHMDALLARVERLITSRKALKDGYGHTMVIDGLGVEIDSADEALMKQLFEVAEAHIGECTFGVGELAVELGLSPRHLRRRIKEATNESPAALLRRYRLEVAARLLAAGAACVSEAGYRVGYTSPASFGNQFKKHFGVSPSDYAAAQQEADHP